MLSTAQAIPLQNSRAFRDHICLALHCAPWNLARSSQSVHSCQINGENMFGVNDSLWPLGNLHDLSAHERLRSPAEACPSDFGSPCSGGEWLGLQSRLCLLPAVYCQAGGQTSLCLCSSCVNCGRAHLIEVLWRLRLSLAVR